MAAVKSGDTTHKLPSADLHHVLDYTRDLWEDLRGARLFITGGTGFFGCWLVESLLFANRQLGLGVSASILTRRPDSVGRTLPHWMLDRAISLHEGDVRTFEFPRGEYSHIIHAATDTGSQVAIIDPLDRFTSNIAGTRRVLELAIAAGTSKFLFTSSGAVYGAQPPGMTHIPEHYAGAPETNDLATAYGQSKRASEFLCTAYAGRRGLQPTIARCFAFVGPRLPLDANYAIGNFIRDAMTGRSIQISSDGTSYRSYLYAADLAIWLWTILLRGQPCRPYNVGSNVALSIGDLAQRVKEVVAPTAEVKVIGKPIMGKPAERYVPSIERCESELGLQVRIPLPEAIRRTAGWYVHEEQEGA